MHLLLTIRVTALSIRIYCILLIYCYLLNYKMTIIVKFKIEQWK